VEGTFAIVSPFCNFSNTPYVANIFTGLGELQTFSTCIHIMVSTYMHVHQSYISFEPNNITSLSFMLAIIIEGHDQSKMAA